MTSEVEAAREIRRCGACHNGEMRCTGVTLNRGDRTTLLEARYRCGACGHAIRIVPGAFGQVLACALAVALFVGVPVRVFVHDMVQVSSAVGWYEWLQYGGMVLVGLALGGGIVFAARKGIAAAWAAIRNPLLRVEPPPSAAGPR